VASGYDIGQYRLKFFVHEKRTVCYTWTHFETANLNQYELETIANCALLKVSICFTPKLCHFMSLNTFFPL
jgi:hypothetical protein